MQGTRLVKLNVLQRAYVRGYAHRHRVRPRESGALHAPTLGLSGDRSRGPRCRHTAKLHGEHSAGARDARTYMITSRNMTPADSGAVQLHLASISDAVPSHPGMHIDSPLVRMHSRMSDYRTSLRRPERKAASCAHTFKLLMTPWPRASQHCRCVCNE